MSQRTLKRLIAAGPIEARRIGRQVVMSRPGPRLTSRVVDGGETLLLHVTEVMGTCQRGLARVEASLDLVERMGPGVT